MSLVKGKKGLIMGVANERSIAWGISQKGTPIVPFLKMGYQNAKPVIEIALQVCANRIEKEWKKSRPALKR